MMKPTPLITIAITAIALLLSAIAPGHALAQGQAPRGGQGEAVLAPADAKVLAQVRVPVSHANIHTGPSTGNEVIVLAARGTVLPMVARRGEWLQVQLSPDLRKTGMVMRWYKNQGSGWVHDSMVEFVTPEPK
jgi:Bacterial SH3 domain